MNGKKIGQKNVKDSSCGKSTIVPIQPQSLFSNKRRVYLYNNSNRTKTQKSEHPFFSQTCKFILFLLSHVFHRTKYQGDRDEVDKANVNKNLYFYYFV